MQVTTASFLEKIWNLVQAPTLYGGAGTDTLLLNEASKGVADAAFTYWYGIEHATFNPGDADDTLNLGLKAQATGIRKANVLGAGSNIDASSMTEAIHLIASGSANDLTGGAGADTIVGGTGVNVLTTKGGNDTMTGGAGADDFIVDGTSAQTVTITDFGTGGADSVETQASATVSITVKNSTGVTAADDENYGTTTVTVTDDVVTGSTVTFAAVNGAAAGEVGFNITSAGNNNGIIVTGGGLMTQSTRAQVLIFER